MSWVTRVVKKPLVRFAVILPVALIVQFFLLESFMGISLPTDRGSAVSSYEIRQKALDLHFITRNKRFSIVDFWSNGTARETLVLRESFVVDRQDGIEGDTSMVKVEALDGRDVKWSFEEAGEYGQPFERFYEVTKLGCCDAPNTYTYFSLRDGKMVRRTHRQLNRDELAALEQSLYN